MYWARRGRRNLGIGLLTAFITYAVFQLSTDKNHWAFRASMATGYASVALLAWALAIGPWRVLRGRAIPTSVDLRRDVGIWSAILAVAHIVTGLQVHMGGYWLNYFLYRPAEGHHTLPLRTDPFGIANWTGLAAGLVFVFLIAISNDRSLRALGPKRWKSWQRWTYLAASLTALHGIAFQLMDKRSAPFVVVFVGTVVAVLLFQLNGRRLLRTVQSSPDA